MVEKAIMLKIKLFLVLLLVMASCSNTNSITNYNNVYNSEIIVAPVEEINSKQVDIYVDKINNDSKFDFELIKTSQFNDKVNFIVLRPTDNLTENEYNNAVKELVDLPYIKYAEPNLIVSAQE